MTISGASTSASSLLAQLQQQLLAGYVSANSTSSAGSTASASQTSPLALFGGDDSNSWTGASNSAGSSNSTDASPTGGQIGFGPGMLAQLLSYLESQTSTSSASAVTSTTSNAVDATSNATDTTSNSTDASSNSTDTDPIAEALFSAISDGGSTISKSQLEAAFTANGGTINSADALYSQLTGSNNSTDGITLSEFETSLPQPGGPGGAFGPPPGGPPPGGFGGGQDTSSAGGSGSTNGTTQTVTNANGSTTTTITYADGTTITISEPASVTSASTSASNSADSTNSTASTNSSDSTNSTDTASSQWALNFEHYITQMLDIQSQLFSSNLGSQLSLSA